MDRRAVQAELDAIVRRTQVKLLVGVLQRPEDSYEWDRACVLDDVLRAKDREQNAP